MKVNDIECWWRRLRSGIIAIAGFVGGVALLFTNEATIVEKYHEIEGDGDAHLLLRDARATTLFLAQDFVDNPNHVSHALVTFVVDKSVGAMLRNCRVKSDDENGSSIVLESNRVNIAKSNASVEQNFIVRFWPMAAGSKVRFYLDCNDNISNLLDVTLPKTPFRFPLFEQ